MKKTSALALIIFFLLPGNIMFAQGKKPAVKSSPEITLPALPVLEGSSKNPVLIRYKFETGKVTGINYSMTIDTKITVGKDSVAVPMIINFEGKYIINSVDENGDASAALIVTRLTAESSKETGGSFDSNQEPSLDSENFAPLRAFLNVPIPVRISSVGKILETDMTPISEIINKTGDAARRMDFEKLTNDMMRSSFIQLPLKSVKAGDSYDAGTIVQKMEQMGELAAQIKYKVQAVSGDGTKLILVPSGKYSMKSAANPNFKTVLNNGYLKGWILFDLKRGTIESSAGTASIDITMSQGSQRFSVKMDMQMKFQTSDIVETNQEPPLEK